VNHRSWSWLELGADWRAPWVIQHVTQHMQGQPLMQSMTWSEPQHRHTCQQQTRCMLIALLICHGIMIMPERASA
jgi:hypothetical protein